MKGDKTVLLITGEHFRKALADKSGFTGQTCIVAQAAKEVFPYKRVSIGFTSAQITNERTPVGFSHDVFDPLGIIKMYDWQKFAELHAALPAEVTLEER